VILCAEKGESMPTLEELKAQKKELEEKIKEVELSKSAPDWMDFLRERLPGFERLVSDGFRCQGVHMTSYADPYFLTVHGTWNEGMLHLLKTLHMTSYADPYFLTVHGTWNEGMLHLLKTLVEMLEAAKRGELEGWPND
jgi:hypothetical protein